MCLMQGSAMELQASPFSIIFYIKNGCLIDDIIHPNNNKYSNQRILVVNIKEYVYLVPYVEEEKERFLKTIIPSRKATKQYLGD